MQVGYLQGFVYYFYFLGMAFLERPKHVAKIKQQTRLSLICTSSLLVIYHSDM